MSDGRYLLVGVIMTALYESVVYYSLVVTAICWKILETVFKTV